MHALSFLVLYTRWGVPPRIFEEVIGDKANHDQSHRHYGVDGLPASKILAA